MLYQLIPPILIILSLIGIILFIMKRSDKIASIDLQQVGQEENFFEEKKSFFAKSAHKVRSKVNGDSVKNTSLALLERVTRKSRMFFLKLESKFSDWSLEIRNRRKAAAEKRKTIAPAAGETKARVGFSATPEGATKNSGQEDDILARLQEYSPKERVRQVFPAHKDKPVVAFEEERVARPIISERVTAPRKKTEIKDRLEELLIERIAANPKDIEAYERLGEYYSEIGSLIDAKECFKQVLKLDPTNRSVKSKMRRLENALAKK